MCFQVKCDKCGKTTWGGCGNHVESALRGVPKDQICTCKKRRPLARLGSARVLVHVHVGVLRLGVLVLMRHLRHDHRHDDRHVKCSKCGKTTWGGCGNHIESALRGVPKDQLCTCKKD
ncbi:Hypothetical Protein FCC1311_020382 [Hondaea fermentalgiana]|uniref:Uncharacterized protein n=1 Tax=Hondaea fermentalgiana TaxID=2315210 RepID=A0A2R5G666_9STRA|nr:Hypothetical Protein FCC1311_020382 [Hondaea fermentalgiana]|eukprot:GBG25819.1 Hypothetical Protein FCC1311_020382 [Hondaea fermentalgiana]